MPNPKDRDEPPVGQLISPDVSPPPDVDVEATARRRPALTAAQRAEVSAEQLITELKADKESLRAELRAVRSNRSKEIPHLREDVRWLERRRASLSESLTTLKTSYEWAISFNWFSTAPIAVGGGGVSYAAFLPATKTVANLSFAALLIGVILQAIVSIRGTRTLRNLPTSEEATHRPPPNPPETPAAQ
ncbi:MAG TPA: hypothetical protein VG406_04830 [Isosphaeraceae bacterium]|nr:hypothetical protein [Isosphaeraceae bacterium]